MKVFTSILFFILLFSPFAQATEDKSYFLIDLNSQQILIQNQQTNKVALPHWVEESLNKASPLKKDSVNQSIERSEDLLNFISSIPITQWKLLESNPIDSKVLKQLTKKERDFLTSKTTKIICHQKINNHWLGVYLSTNPTINGNTRNLLVILVNYIDELELLKHSVQLIEHGLWNFELHTVFRKGQIIGQAPVFKGNTSNIRFVIHKDLLITLPKPNDLSDLSIVITHQTPLVAPIDTETPLGQLSIQWENQLLATSPIFAEIPIETGNFLHRLCDTIRLVIFPH